MVWERMLWDAAAARRIFEAKGRPQDNPLIAHIADMAMLDKLCHDIPEAARRIAARFWPGPLTMALPKRPIVPDAVTAGLSTVGVRYPSHPVAQMLIRAAAYRLPRLRLTVRVSQALRRLRMCLKIWMDVSTVSLMGEVRT